MKKFISILTILFSLGLHTSVKADVFYQGHIHLTGLLGESTQFELQVEYYGDGPCFIKGQTIYTRKNGSTSKIPVYGVWDIETSGRFTLSEIYNGQVCGTFNFTITDIPSIDDEPLMHPLTNGSWKYDGKELKFNNVNYCEPNPKYEATPFMSYRRGPKYNASGIYSYMYIGKDKNKPVDLRRVRLGVATDKIDWNFSLNKKGKEEILNSTNPKGYVSEESGQIWTPFSIGNADFDAIVLDDAILVYQCNPECVPDGKIPLGYTIEGIYLKEADMYNGYKTRSFKDDDPDAISYCELEVNVPRVQDKRLNDSIQAWFRLRLNDDTDLPMERIADKYMDDYLSNVYDPSEGHEDGEFENWELCFLTYSLTYSGYDEKRVINLCSSGYDHTGGIHGMPFSTTNSMRRSDGKILDWDFFFSNKDKIKHIVSDQMRMQNGEVEFDQEGDLDLPYDDPWLEDGNLHFHYGPYEAAPYVYGQPECAIPVSELLPYMTPAAQKLVK